MSEWSQDGNLSATGHPAVSTLVGLIIGLTSYYLLGMAGHALTMTGSALVERCRCAAAKKN